MVAGPIFFTGGSRGSISGDHWSSLITQFIKKFKKTLLKKYIVLVKYIVPFPNFSLPRNIGYFSINLNSELRIFHSNFKNFVLFRRHNKEKWTLFSWPPTLINISIFKLININIYEGTSGIPEVSFKIEISIHNIIAKFITIFFCRNCNQIVHNYNMCNLPA